MLSMFQNLLYFRLLYVWRFLKDFEVMSFWLAQVQKPVMPYPVVKKMKRKSKQKEKFETREHYIWGCSLPTVAKLSECILFFTLKKNIDTAKIRTWNPLIRSQMPYPLGHGAKHRTITLFVYYISSNLIDTLWSLKKFSAGQSLRTHTHTKKTLSFLARPFDRAVIICKMSSLIIWASIFFISGLRKIIDLARIRPWNPLIGSPMPYPLGQRATQTTIV